MKFRIEHGIRGRLRVNFADVKMSIHQADMLLYYILEHPQVSKAKVYQRTGSAAVWYEGDKVAVLLYLADFHFGLEQLERLVPEHTARELNTRYYEMFISLIARRAISQVFFPQCLRVVTTFWRSLKYIRAGLHSLRERRIKVEVLDATVIVVSMLCGDFDTAGSVMFMLSVGETLEEWTHKKSIDDLARSMELNVDKVWLLQGETQVQVPVRQIQAGDRIVVHMGALIPLDGVVTDGEAMVNQASLTGESTAVRKKAESAVYAGTVLEEGELTIQVNKAHGATRYENIVNMINETEKLKSSLEGKAYHLADRLVPFSLLGTLGAYLLTGNVQKALSILMVDFSCALKLAMPIAVLSAMRESSEHNITVKGGKFLEAIAEADTIVFDKTGTLTKATPKYVDLIPFGDWEKDELLRIAACLEEHFPHSMASAVVKAAQERGLNHEEMHSKVEYTVAHGITSYIEGKRVIIGSQHFVFEDEGAVIPAGDDHKFTGRPPEYSHLYLAIAGQLAAIICIEDPVREETAEVIQQLRQAGFKNIVMMTGDSRRTARAIAAKVGIEEFYSEVLPEDKAEYVQKVKMDGRKVVMIGDGINDSPALSAADVGIAMREGAAIAREIADVTISADNLYELVTLKQISTKLMKRIRNNYRAVIGFNSGFILLGVSGVIVPTTSALLHNTSTVLISLKSMTKLLD